jgi:hypothetical protein
LAPALLAAAIALAGAALDRAAAESLQDGAARAHRHGGARNVAPASFFPTEVFVGLEQDNVTQLSATLRETRRRVLDGAATRTDLAEVAARLAAARSALHAAEAQYAADRASYLAIVGVSPEEIVRKRGHARGIRR